jgi:hypothetical protein
MPGRRHPAGVGEAPPRPAPSSDPTPSLDDVIAGLADLDADPLRLQWRNHLGGTAPAHLPRWLLLRILAYRMQAVALGDLDKATLRILRQSKGDGGEDSANRPFEPRDPATRDGIGLKAGALLVREWNGRLERVMVLEKGFAWNGRTYGSLSQIAKAMTGTSWNGHRFFALRPASPQDERRAAALSATRARRPSTSSLSPKAPIGLDGPPASPSAPGLPSPGLPPSLRTTASII